MPHTISLRFLEFYPGLQTFVDDSTLPPKTAGKTPVTGPLLSITLLDASCLSANVFGAVVCPNWDFFFSPCFLLGTVKVAPDPRTAYRGAAYPCLSGGAYGHPRLFISSGIYLVPVCFHLLVGGWVRRLVTSTSVVPLSHLVSTAAVTAAPERVV